MKRRPTTAVTVATAAAVASMLAVPALAGIDAGGRLIVAIELRADTRDAVTVCQDQPFGEGVESFADTVAAALALPLTEATASPDSDCFALNLTGPMTTRGPHGERALRFDGGALSSVATQAGYAEAFLVVCTPNVTDRVEVRTGDDPIEAGGCDANGYAWPLLSPLDIDVAYRATGWDLAEGLLAAASWWIALATLMGLVVARSSRLGVLRRMPLLGGATGAIVAGAGAYGWVFVSSRSPLLDSLAMLAGIGGGGEVAIMTIGSAVAVTLTAFTARRVVRGAGRPAPAEPSGPVLPGVPSLPLRDVVGPYAEQIRRAGAGLLWAFVPVLSFGVAYLIFLLTPAADEIKIEGMLATALAYAMLAPAFTAATLPAAYDARRLMRDEEAPLLDALRAAGSSVREIWRTPVPPAAAPAGGAALVAGRRAYVWEPLLALPADELAGGVALRGAKRRSWVAAFAGAAVVVVYGWVRGSDVPAVVVFVPMALLTAIGFLDAIERIRVRSAARNSAAAGSRLRGLLILGRAHARLAAGAALGAVAMPMPGYAQAHWERTMRIAHRIGLDAGLSTVDVARIADEAIAADAARSHGRESGAASVPD
ncbi:MAG TPA: hypothetical protein VGB64_03845 [Actinomycetota bacterium]